jgi:dipeptidase
MKSLKYCLLFAAIFLFHQQVYGCFAIIVGKNASADGSVLVAHTEMNDYPRFLNFYKVPRMNFVPGSPLKLDQGGSWTNIAETWSFIRTQNFGCRGSDLFMNEWGVICFSDATPTREDDVETCKKRGDITNGGVCLSLRFEVARRAKTAREGVKIVGYLVEHYGNISPGSTIVVADPNEAWLVAVVTGKHWIAQRVPDDKVVVLPNVNIINEVNLKDTLNFLASADIIEYAVKRGWHDASKAFNFKNAYDLPSDGWFETKYKCDARQWRGQCLVTGKNISLPAKENLPFAVTPSKKLSVQDLRNFLSDHLEFTAFDKVNNFTPANLMDINAPSDSMSCVKTKSANNASGSPHDIMTSRDGMICTQYSQELAVFQLRNWLPADIGCIYWRVTAASCSGVLTPWYFGITQTPEPYRIYTFDQCLDFTFHYNPPPETYVYDDSKAFWIFNELENMVDQKFKDYIKIARNSWQPFEADEFKKQQEIEKTALELYKKDKKAGQDYLTKYSNGLALQAMEKARLLIKDLKTKEYGF